MINTNRKPIQANHQRILEQFRTETGVSEEVEVQDAFPASMWGTIMGDNREWSFKFTPGGIAKRGTFQEESITMYLNHYNHCGTEWSDEHSCMCNDRCPVCDHEIEPYDSEEL